MRIEQTAVFKAWMDGLRDLRARARIQVRIDRLLHGNPGTHRHLAQGVAELKIDVGPGYRVYYLQHRDRWLLLLAGGDKSTQAEDIALALRLANACKEERQDGHE